MSSPRIVSARLDFDVTESALINLQIRAAPSAGSINHESLAVTLDGTRIGPVAEIGTEYGGTIHDFAASPGSLVITYEAALAATTDAGHMLTEVGAADLERHRMLRPSRYCPSDHVGGLALSEFGRLDTPGAKAAAIADWIFHRVEYVPGASDVHDSAENTLLTGKGVCRDFAHLGIVLCRALDVPARFASVYAPGLSPMDFHAVFEAWHDDAWWVYDATRLAPRQSLVRIATGRDAADTSFATVVSGFADLTTMTVTATSEGDLPVDGHDAPIALA